MFSNQGRPLVSGVQAREFNVSITSRHGANLQGLITHHALGQSRYFDSFLEMIHLIKQRLDELGIVQPATEMRSFIKPFAVQGREGRIVTLKNQKSKVNSGKALGKPEFLIRLNLRQNATWQGELHWLNDERKIHFRSLLEMIMLMQEAVEVSGEPVAEYEFRSWQDESDEASTG